MPNTLPPGYEIEAAPQQQAPGGIVMGRARAPTPPAPPSGYTGDQNGLRPIPGGPADPNAPRAPTAGDDPFNRERQLRTAYGTSKPVEALQTVRPQAQIIGELARKSAAHMRGEGPAPTAPDDMAMVFSFMKLLDPTSVVRETEYANAQNAAGIPDRIRNLYNQAMRGTILTPAQRAEFFATATTALDAYTNGAASQSDYYRELATDYDLNPDHVAKPIRRPAPRVRRSPSAPAQRNVGAAVATGGLGALGGMTRPAPPRAKPASNPFASMSDDELRAIAGSR